MTRTDSAIARNRFRVSSDFMFARLCPSPSVWPVGVRDHPPRRAGRRERQCGHHRRARRNGGPAPRAGPSARSRDLRSASRGAAARRASFSRLRTRLRSTAPPTPLVTVSPTRAPGTASFPVSSRRRDCSVKVATDSAASARDALKFGPSGQAANRFAGGARDCRPHARRQGSLPRRLHRHANGRTTAEAAGRVDQAESFLRPRARRAASTLRPPTVAERARKP